MHCAFTSHEGNKHNVHVHVYVLSCVTAGVVSLAPDIQIHLTYNALEV